MLSKTSVFPMLQSLSPLFKEFIESLNSANVEYLIVGGYAVSHYGRPRYTGDMDFWLAVSPSNAARVVKTLEEFGLGSLGLSSDAFLERDVVIQLGREPLRIDLLTGLSGLDFESCYPRRVQVEMDGVLIPFIHLNDLRINKASTGRAKDIADLDRLPQTDS